MYKMAESGQYLDFLHNSHMFASTVGDVLEEEYLRQTTDLEISLPQFNLIRLIEANGACQVRDVAMVLGISQAAASKNVDKLVRLGLVLRQVQQNNRRATSLTLTVRGKNLFQKYELLKKEKLEHVFHHFTQEELADLTQGFQKLAFLILKQEKHIKVKCMRCRAYYIEECPLRDLPDVCCVYAQNRSPVMH